MTNTLLDMINHAIGYRKNLSTDPGTNVYRIFNGYTEGIPDLILEVYGTSLLIFDHGKNSTFDTSFFEEVRKICWQNFPFLTSVFLKRRNGASEKDKKGNLLFGKEIVQFVVENDVKYAVHFQTNQDSSFYTDTRNLRIWLKNHSSGKTVVNTFAYTGSLGVAALSGGASKVIQTDITPRFLDLARLSGQLNGIPTKRHAFIEGDFYRVVSRLKTGKALYDTVIIDPPFFSSTEAGTVDLSTDSSRLINKVRPIVKHEGTIILVNNSLFLKGTTFYEQVESLCQNEYVSIKEIIPVPLDVTGYPETIKSSLSIDPAPFNHSTKMIILDIKRKDNRTE